MATGPAADFPGTPLSGARDLACRYAALLDLYAELEAASETVFAAIEEGVAPDVLNGHLRGKLAVAERIVRESRGIASLKQEVADAGGLWDDERELVHELEARLTLAVNRMVEQENRGRDLVMRRGMRVVRR